MFDREDLIGAQAGTLRDGISRPTIWRKKVLNVWLSHLRISAKVDTDITKFIIRISGARLQTFSRRKS